MDERDTEPRGLQIGGRFLARDPINSQVVSESQAYTLNEELDAGEVTDLGTAPAGPPITLGTQPTPGPAEALSPEAPPSTPPKGIRVIAKAPDGTTVMDGVIPASKPPTSVPPPQPEAPPNNVSAAAPESPQPVAPEVPQAVAPNTDALPAAPSQEPLEPEIRMPVAPQSADRSGILSRAAAAVVDISGARIPIPTPGLPGFMGRNGQGEARTADDHVATVAAPSTNEVSGVPNETPSSMVSPPSAVPDTGDLPTRTVGVAPQEIDLSHPDTLDSSFVHDPVPALPSLPAIIDHRTAAALNLPVGQTVTEVDEFGRPTRVSYEYILPDPARLEDNVVGLATHCVDLATPPELEPFVTATAHNRAADIALETYRAATPSALERGPFGSLLDMVLGLPRRIARENSIIQRSGQQAGEQGAEAVIELVHPATAALGAMGSLGIVDAHYRHLLGVVEAPGETTAQAIQAATENGHIIARADTPPSTTTALVISPNTDTSYLFRHTLVGTGTSEQPVVGEIVAVGLRDQTVIEQVTRTLEERDTRRPRLDLMEVSRQLAISAQAEPDVYPSTDAG
jgi:hypothetical protein